MNEKTPKNFVLQLGSLASLYLSVTFLLVLLFGVINALLPDSADSYYALESNQSGIRLGIAMLLVFFPTYLYLTRQVNVIRRAANDSVYLGITRWLLYLSLLVAGFAILIDVVVLIMAFLEGELTARFLLKVVAVLGVVGLAFNYYIKDVKGYWLENEKASKAYALVISVFVAGAIVLGFMNIGTPETARLAKIDNAMVGDLQDMQWRVEDYQRTKSMLPAGLEEVYEGFSVPTPPEDRPAYRYEIVDEDSYKLCATFHLSSENQSSMARPMYEKNYNWEHGEGEWCFERTIDDLYRQ